MLTSIVLVLSTFSGGKLTASLIGPKPMMIEAANSIRKAWDSLNAIVLSHSDSHDQNPQS